MRKIDEIKKMHWEVSLKTPQSICPEKLLMLAKEALLEQRWLIGRVIKLEEVANEVLSKGAVCELCTDNHERLLDVLLEDK